MGGVSNVPLIKDGKRLDGRKPDELRDVRIEAGVLERADGSAYLEWGSNKVLAAVYGPQEVLPKHLSDPTKAVLTYRYNMAPFSVDDRKRPGPDRRSVEISKISAEALEKVVLLEQFPNTMIKVFVEVLQAEAGTRCAALTAASVALADAGIPMRDLVVACAAGKINDTVVLDLGKSEDNFGQADVPIAIVPHTGEIVLMQMDGDLTRDEYTQALDLAVKGSMQVYELQKDALKRRYGGVVDEQ
ncbi:MAG: exosome complex exonuclease Rrp41 [Candidatus Diapherotrites archaeon]|nr:exosome complex exonuclease Rrp41 [Candidatus Diapherotrites archaeon]